MVDMHITGHYFECVHMIEISSLFFVVERIKVKGKCCHIRTNTFNTYGCHTRTNHKKQLPLRYFSEKEDSITQLRKINARLHDHMQHIQLGGMLGHQNTTFLQTFPFTFNHIPLSRNLTLRPTS
jgi:hypothetical protein